MRRVVAVSAIVLSAGCASAEHSQSSQAGQSCQITDLQEVFSSPAPVYKATFCGKVLAIHEGRMIKFFPYGSVVPSDRNDIVVIPDRRTTEALRNRISIGTTAVVYVRGTINAEGRCFDDQEIMCLPFRRPYDLKVSSFHVTTN